MSGGGYGRMASAGWLFTFLSGWAAQATVMLVVRSPPSVFAGLGELGFLFSACLPAGDRRRAWEAVVFRSPPSFVIHSISRGAS
jgi:hypothetical protein